MRSLLLLPPLMFLAAISVAPPATETPLVTTVEREHFIAKTVVPDDGIGEPIDLTLTAPTNVKAGVPFMVALDRPAEVGDHYRWIVTPTPTTPPIELLSRSGQPMLWVQGVRTHTTISVFAQIPSPGLDPIGQVSHAVHVGDLPPDPEPDPDPEPEPDPTPDDAPIPEPGFRVLIVYETGDNLPPGQQSILYGKQTRDWLNANCVKEADGTAAYRIFDQNVDVTDALPVWKTAMARERESIPWLLVSNGKSGFEGPLPATVTEFLELCGRYAK